MLYSLPSETAKFIGWYKDEECTELINTSTSFNLYGSTNAAFISCSTTEADAPTTTIYAKFEALPIVWRDYAEAPVSGGKYYIYNVGFCGLAGLYYGYTDGVTLRGKDDPNEAVAFTITGETKISISYEDGGVTYYLDANGTYIRETESPAKTLTLMEDGTYMVNLNNNHASGYTWWDMSTSTYNYGAGTFAKIDATSLTQRWRFIPEAKFKALCSVESLNETGSITINSAPTASGTTNVKFNVSDIGPVSAFDYTISGGDGNFELGTPTRSGNVISVPVTYTAHNVHSSTSTPLTTATVTLTAKNDAATSASGQVPVYVDLQPKFALNVNTLDWSYNGETLVETYYAGMEVAASQRDRLTNKLVYNMAQTTGVAADYATWTATIIGANADQFKFANGTQTVTGPYTPELLDVIFAPTATGEMSATLHIETSYTDANSNTQTDTKDISLSGKAEAVSVITFAADGNQSPNNDEHYSYGDIIGTNAKDVTADLFMVGLSSPSKTWRDPDGVFEFDVNTVDLTKTNQTLTFRAHRQVPALAETDHTATLTISGTGAEGAVSAVLTLTYHAMPLLTPEVTWNWSEINENATSTEPLSTTSDGAWTLTKTAGDIVTYDAEAKTATVPYLHHEPGISATFAFSISQTDTYAAMSETYTASVVASPAAIHLTTTAQFNDASVMKHTSYEKFDESKHELYIDYSDNVDFYLSGHTTMSFDYLDKGTTTWTVTEFDAENNSTVILSGYSFSAGANTITFNPTAATVRLRGAGSGAYFTDVRFTDNDTITVDYDKVVLINDNGTIHDLDVTATFSNTQSATVALNATAAQYFELQCAGKESGATIVFDSNDLGLGTVKEKVIKIALKAGANSAAAKAATAGNACKVTFGDNYTYNHHEFSLPVVLMDAYDVTFKHDEHGSYKVQYEVELEGVTVSSTDYVEHLTTIDPTLCTVTMSAPTPAAGYVFQGWKVNGEIVSLKSSVTKILDEPVIVEPVFAMGEAVFGIDDAFFGELGEALSAAGSVADQEPVVVLLKDLALTTPATYTIPAGVTLLIPYKDGFNELQKTPETVPVTAETLAAYRTLTIKEGVNIICNGNICVSGKIMAAGGGNKSAYVTGACGVINMANGGHIELNDGANLYCWGFIKGQDMDQGNNTQGTGTITANAGATVYEDFELGDWRGGTASSNIYFESEKMLFPFQSYSIQNVEIPTTYHYGSTLTNYLIVHTGFGDFGFEVSTIGTERTMFLLLDENSVIRKWYDPTTDLSCFELNGTAQLGSLIINMPFVGDFDSGEYNLPISNSMHVILANCDMTLAKPLTVQAGAVFEIKNTATVNLEAKVHIFDVDEWGKYIHNYYFRSFNNLTSHKDRGAEDSKEGLDDAKFIVDGVLNVKSGQGYIYSTIGGANIMGNGGGIISFEGELPEAGTLWQVNVLSGSPYITWVENDEDAANLRNEDGTFTKSTEYTTFYNINGRWFNEAISSEKNDHTYDFWYLNNGNGGEEVQTSAVYSHDKTGLEAREKWFNVSADEDCPEWWNGADGNRYNYSLLNEWHQFIETETENVYSGSDNKLYQRDDCVLLETGAVDKNCLYTFEDEDGNKTKMALVDGHFIPLESNGYDPAYHNTENTAQYYICFSGCNWHEATPYTGEYKSYTIAEGGDYIWFENDWLNVEREEPYFYTADEQTNVKTYYEYLNGEWVIATPFIRVQDNMETREFYMVKEAFNVAQIKKNVTITLLRDAQAEFAAYTFNALNTTCTLDLNGHALDLTITGSGTTEVKMFAINMGSGSFTITDNSTYKNGELRLHAAPTTATQSKRWHGLYVQGGELIIEAGKVYVEDMFTYTSTSNSGIVSAITIAAGQKFTLNDGEVEATSPYAPYGVHMVASTNTTGKTYINGGAVTATSTSVTNTIGLYIGSGTAYVSGGTINATTKTTTARGIYVEGSASNYIGHLEMTGGTVNATATTTTAYGIYVGGTYSFNNTKPNTVKATFRGVANISGGTINAEALGTTTAYGIVSLGTTEVTGGTFNVKVKTTTVGGLLVQDGTTTISGSPVFNVTATKTTAYGIYANGVTPTSTTGRPYNPVVTVNGGTFNVSTLGTTTAYGININGATRAITSTASGYYAGNYASAGTVIVNDGVFNVTAKTTTSYAMVVGAAATQAGATDYAEATATPRCTINGGWFKTAGTSTVNVANAKAAADALNINGGYFSHSGNLATYAAAPNIVITLPKTDANYPTYKYEVAEGYTITFMNGETQLQSNNQKAGEQIEYSATEPTKANTETNSYIFDGWATEADGEMVYAKGNLPTVTANATYYAHFAETTLKCKVYFDPRGGVGSVDYIYVAPNSKISTAISAMPTATKTGYTLKGWYNKTSSGTKQTIAKVITQDTTFYAQWTAVKHNLTWEMGDGVVTTAGKVGSSTVFPAVDATGTQTYNLSYAAAIVAPVVSRAGYTFVNWGVPTIAATMPLNDLTYTAQWKANTNTPYVVKHMQENPATGDFDIEADSEDLTGTTDTYVTPKTKSYPGYATPTAQTVQILADGSQVVTYNYSLIRYTITFDATTNGGTCATTSAEVAHSATLILPEATKEGYTFVGWFTKPVGGDQITNATVIQRNIGTLYAQFTSSNIVAGTSGDADDVTVTISDPEMEANALVVEKDGVVKIKDGASLTVDNFILESTGNQSGQVVNLTETNLTVSHHVYFDFIPNGTAGTQRRTWYAIAVPWEVDAANGISLKDGRKLVLGRDFDLIYYNVEKRAAEGDSPQCWKYVEYDDDKVMHPGQMYMMYFGQEGWTTIRFEKIATAPIIAAAPSVKTHSSAIATDANWNGIANPAVYHAYLSATQVTYGQVLNNGSLDDYIAKNESNPVYETVQLNSYKFVVGKPVYVQAPEETPVMVKPAIASSLAPRRAKGNDLPDGIDNVFMVTIAEKGMPTADNLFIQTAEEKADRYVIGQDLAKGGVAKTCAQLWVNRYDSKLSVNTIAPVNGVADYPLAVSIPQTGDYTIAIENAHGEATDLYLTKDGEAIWNLSDGKYTGTFDKGTTNEYGLRIIGANAPQTATGIGNVQSDNVQCTKALHDGVIYIIRGEKVYTIDGQLVK
ncbi:MAG: InlB B-repeat-containing protein [Paludibacteraceae bacterium]|nr:InlB B-repeat-containing protein [Paludibacteraceae bacterium]